MSISPSGLRHAQVSTDPIDTDALVALVGSARMGAVVTFAGVVRDHDTPGRGRVVRLDYEAHPDAAGVMREVCMQIAATHPESAIAAVHRIGSLSVGDPALVVAVASAHRREAFVTASDLVDLIKERLPVWKHQIFTDGSDEWVGLGAAAPVPG